MYGLVINGVQALVTYGPAAYSAIEIGSDVIDAFDTEQEEFMKAQQAYKAAKSKYRQKYHGSIEPI